MNTVSKAICWALAILIVAAAMRFGFMDRETATTVLIVLLVLAVLSLRERSCCGGEAA